MIVVLDLSIVFYRCSVFAKFESVELNFYNILIMIQERIENEYAYLHDDALTYHVNATKLIANSMNVKPLTNEQSKSSQKCDTAAKRILKR
jgi:hypothetical protein